MEVVWAVFSSLGYATYPSLKERQPKQMVRYRSKFIDQNLWIYAFGQEFPRSK
jgi:hypothetical protein